MFYVFAFSKSIKILLEKVNWFKSLNLYDISCQRSMALNEIVCLPVCVFTWNLWRFWLAAYLVTWSISVSYIYSNNIRILFPLRFYNNVIAWFSLDLSKAYLCHHSLTFLSSKFIYNSNDFKSLAETNKLVSSANTLKERTPEQFGRSLMYSKNKKGPWFVRTTQYHPIRRIVSCL